MMGSIETPLRDSANRNVKSPTDHWFRDRFALEFSKLHLNTDNRNKPAHSIMLQYPDLVRNAARFSQR
jgi:hypothetical protein